MISEKEKNLAKPLPNMTWAVLLAHYTQIAQASMALPKTPAGDRWRAAVPALIGLSAVAAALGDMEALSEGERALSLTRADMLIRQHATQVHALWKGEELPADVVGLIADASEAARRAREGGLEWRVGEQGEGVMEAPAWNEMLHALGESAGTIGLLLLPARDETVLGGTPFLFARGRFGGAPSPVVVRLFDETLGVKATPVSGPHQVYRQTTPESGGVARDVIAPMASALLPGRPLLHVAIVEGAVQTEPAPARSRRAQFLSFGAWRVERSNPGHA